MFTSQVLIVFHHHVRCTSEWQSHKILPGLLTKTGKRVTHDPNQIDFSKILLLSFRVESDLS